VSEQTPVMKSAWLRNIIFIAFSLSVLFLGFTLGRNTNLFPYGKSSRVFKNEQVYRELGDLEKDLTQAIAKASPTIAKEVLAMDQVDPDSLNAAFESLTPAEQAYAKMFSVAAVNYIRAITKQDLPETMEEKIIATKDAYAKKMQDVRSKYAKARPVQKPQAQLEDILKEGPKTVQVPENAYAVGDPNAPITIVSFNELLCPFSAKNDPVLKELQKKYGQDKIRIVYQNFIVHGDQARFFHRALLAAGRQGKFWEFLNDMYATRSEWTRAYDRKNFNEDEVFDKVIKPHVEKLGLDAAKLRQEMGDAAIDEQIDTDTKYGRSLGIAGTPGSFVNGYTVRGAYPQEVYEKIIDKLLAETASK